MNIESEKLEIMRMVLETDDAALILAIKALLKNKEQDCFDQLSPEAQQDVQEGLAQADRGETVAHAHAVDLLGKWGLK